MTCIRTSGSTIAWPTTSSPGYSGPIRYRDAGWAISALLSGPRPGADAARIGNDRHRDRIAKGGRIFAPTQTLGQGKPQVLQSIRPAHERMDRVGQARAAR